MDFYRTTTTGKPSTLLTGSILPATQSCYKGDRKISFVSYHTRAISMNIVRTTAWTLHDAAQKAKGRLCGKHAGSPAALG